MRRFANEHPILFIAAAALTLTACGAAGSSGLFGGLGVGVIGLLLLFATGGSQGCGGGGCIGPCLDVVACLSPVYVPPDAGDAGDAGATGAVDAGDAGGGRDAGDAAGDAGRDASLDAGGEVGALRRHDLLQRYRDRLPVDVVTRLEGGQEQT